MFDLTISTLPDAADIANKQSCPVRIDAAHTTSGLPAKIFVYKDSAPPLDGQDFFSCVASAPQMTELPEDSPAPGLPFYRVATLTVITRSESHAKEFREKIVRAVQDLADNLSLVDFLQPEVVITIVPKT